jgi:hypothetical protein
MSGIGKHLTHWEVIGDEEKYDALVKMFNSGGGEYHSSGSILLKGNKDPAEGVGFIISRIKSIKIIDVKEPVWTPRGGFSEIVFLIKTYHGESYLLSSGDFSKKFAHTLKLYGLKNEFIPTITS